MGNDVTTVKHIDKNTVIISPAKGWEVTIFNVVKGRVIEACVSDGEETIKLSLEGPDDAYGVGVTHNGASGETIITYKLLPKIGPHWLET